MKNRHDDVDKFLSEFDAPRRKKRLKRWHGVLGLVTAPGYRSGSAAVEMLNGYGGRHWRFELIADKGAVCKVHVWYGWDTEGVKGANANDLQQLLISLGWTKDQFAIDTLDIQTVKDSDD